MSVNFRPMSDRILVQRLAEVEQSPGGLYIPPSAQEKPDQGTVIATGPGRALDNGSVKEPNVKMGDMVLFGAYAGQEITIDSQEYLIIREEDILGVMEQV